MRSTLAHVGFALKMRVAVYFGIRLAGWTGEALSGPDIHAECCTLCS
jgi:hypothetical protein